MSRRLLVVVFLLGFMAAVMSRVTTIATTFDWMSSDDADQVDGVVAYPGCAPAKHSEDGQAIKMAVLKARSNMGRAMQPSTTVSGGEQSRNGAYSLTITETSEAYVGPVLVVRKQFAVINGVQIICVLVAEDVPKGRHE